MAEPDKNFLQQWIDGLPGWKATFNQLQDSFGSLVAALVLVLAGIGFIWWISKDIRERPGVEWVIKRFKRKAIDKAPAGVLTIAVAHLQDDEGQKQEKLLLDELRHFDGVQTLSVDRMVEWPTSGTEHGKKNKAEEDARGLLRQNGADVLVWGSLISLSGKARCGSIGRRRRTCSAQNPRKNICLKPRPLRCLERPEANFGLAHPNPLGRTHLQPGHYIADKLAPLITQVRALGAKKEGIWNTETLAGVQFSLASALWQYGEQSGKNEPLAESIELYRKVLDEWTRERVPLQWATTQSNLGAALWSLGERESETKTLTKAVSAFREALKERTREHVPLQWATTQDNLGNALQSLGSRESGTETLAKAVDAFREALKERAASECRTNGPRHKTISAMRFRASANARAARRRSQRRLMPIARR